MNENKKIEQFFDYNLKIKKLLNDIIPTEMDFYDKSYRTKYLTKLLKNLEEIESYISLIINDYDIPNNIAISFSSKIKQLQKKINSFSFVIILRQGYSSVLDFVHSNITYMRPEFNESVKNGFYGYHPFYGENVLNPITINEFAHYVHSYVVNNQDFYSKAPLVKQEKKGPWQGIFLRGKDNEFGNDLYNKILNTNILSDRMDIINLDKKVIIMARDLGHSTVIEIDINEKSFVKYFISKNTNKEKNSLLKGVYTNDKFVIGSFEVDKENLISDLCHLMEGIATDRDMVFHRINK